MSFYFRVFFEVHNSVTVPNPYLPSYPGVTIFTDRDSPVSSNAEHIIFKFLKKNHCHGKKNVSTIKLPWESSISMGSKEVVEVVQCGKLDVDLI